MYYKLSNLAEKKMIEDEFDRQFEFPNLYHPSPVINGLEESTLSIINAEDSSKIQFSIWGLLPESFEDNWDVFQNVTNTLNINLESLSKQDDLYINSLDKKRCLVIVTGFFTSFLHNGTISPYHVYLEDHRPFCIAGVYSTLEDGFLTCSILLTKARESFNEIPNLSGIKPLVFKKEDYQEWLDVNNSFKSLSKLIKTHETYNFKAHPVSKEFYKENTIYKDIIESGDF